MADVYTFLKYAITLAVVFGILYVLISPLPEMDAALSGKSTASHFILITQALWQPLIFSGNPAREGANLDVGN
jgi:hypothetical protein